MLQERHIPQSR